MSKGRFRVRWMWLMDIVERIDYVAGLAAKVVWLHSR